MSLSKKVKVRPYICGVFLCFNASFTASTSFQNFYDTDILEADVVSLYATSSKVKFTETKTSTRAGYQYKQNISISLPIADELRSEHITRIHQAEQVVLKLTNGEYLFLGRNDARQNTKPKISYFGDENVARFQFENLSIAASGYTDIENIDNGTLFDNSGTYYKFDENSGNVIDYVSNYDAQVFGNVVQGVPGKIFKGIESDGLSDNYLKVPKEAFDQNNFYHSGWFYFDSSYTRPFTMVLRGGSNYGFAVIIISNGDLRVIYFGVENYPLIPSGSLINQWNHFIIEKNNQQIKIYINNNLIIDISDTYFNTTNDLYYGIGINNDGSIRNGVSHPFKLDEFDYRAVPYTQEERDQLYNNGLGTTI